ncbi:protein of unknown function [Kyrpidia spormannii]|uniref:Uncharacterized protein n=1 Tax=Kyrpidia spormannii TaxID=2055160 RepID=A0A6F9EB03_9BACL|nr:protein of unknown function [Kyrpidia spormannii]
MAPNDRTAPGFPGPPNPDPGCSDRTIPGHTRDWVHKNPPRWRVKARLELWTSLPLPFESSDEWLGPLAFKFYQIRPLMRVLGVTGLPPLHGSEDADKIYLESKEGNLCRSLQKPWHSIENSSRTAAMRRSRNQNTPRKRFWWSLVWTPGWSNCCPRR